MLSNKTKRELKIDQRQILIDSIEIGISSPQQILIWGERLLPNGKKVGSIKNSKTVNYKRFTPFRDGLFCERIFGPVTSFVCACGKKQPHSKVTFCEKCEVEYIDARSRRYRLGYISLLSPVTHIWYLKGRPSYLSLFLGKRKKTIVALAYCNAYLIEHGALNQNDTVKNGHIWPYMQAASNSETFFQNFNNLGKGRKKRLLKIDNSKTTLFGIKNLKQSSALHVHDAVAPPRVLKRDVWGSASSPYKSSIVQCKTVFDEINRETKLERSFSLKLLKNARSLTFKESKQNGSSTNSDFKSTEVPHAQRVVQIQAFASPALLQKESFGGEQIVEPILVPMQSEDLMDVRLSSVGASNLVRVLQIGDLYDVRSSASNHRFVPVRRKFVNAAAINQDFKKNEYLSGEASSYGNYFYARQHTLPFLPTLVSHFYLRDALLNFIYSLVSYDDFPIVDYCHLKRREALRDVHQFMAHRTVEPFKNSINNKRLRNSLYSYKSLTCALPKLSSPCDLGKAKGFAYKSTYKSKSTYKWKASHTNLLTSAKLRFARRFVLVRKKILTCKTYIHHARGKGHPLLCSCTKCRPLLVASGERSMDSSYNSLSSSKSSCVQSNLSLKESSLYSLRAYLGVLGLGVRQSTPNPSTLKPNGVRLCSCTYKSSYKSKICKEKGGLALLTNHRFVLVRRRFRRRERLLSMRMQNKIRACKTKNCKELFRNTVSNAHLSTRLISTRGALQKPLLNTLYKSNTDKAISNIVPPGRRFACARTCNKIIQNAADFTVNEGKTTLLDESNRSIISGLELIAIREILSYTGGGALQQLLQQFNQHDLCKFLFAEAQILRRVFETQISSDTSKAIASSFPYFVRGDRKNTYKSFGKYKRVQINQSMPVHALSPFSKEGAVLLPQSRKHSHASLRSDLSERTTQNLFYGRTPFGLDVLGGTWFGRTPKYAQTKGSIPKYAQIKHAQSKYKSSCIQSRALFALDTSERAVRACTYKKILRCKKICSRSFARVRKFAHTSQNLLTSAKLRFARRFVLVSRSMRKEMQSKEARAFIQRKAFPIKEVKNTIAYNDLRSKSLYKINYYKQSFIHACMGNSKKYEIRQSEKKRDSQNKTPDLRKKQILRISRRIYKVSRRLKIAQLLTRNHRKPEWMILSHLPVLPPDLRPILQMSEKVIVASDLNIMYQRVIYRNNRHLRVRFIDFHLVTAIQRLVQDAVDRLIENGKGGLKPYYTQGGRPLKSLSDILKGKKGRFRLNLLGKRVDFSGRSVIVVSPLCQIHECGLPKDIALELYHYFLLRQLIVKKYCASIVTAKKMIKSKSSLMWDILRLLMYHHPVLLNRAPTLHRLGIQAFQPKLVLGNAILLHPLVCSGFNADFDGDQMGVHLPLSFAARAESWDLLWSRNNLLSPATGQPMLVPSQDMVLGFYYITARAMQRNSQDKRLKLAHLSRDKSSPTYESLLSNSKSSFRNIAEDAKDLICIEKATGNERGTQKDSYRSLLGVEVSRELKTRTNSFLSLKEILTSFQSGKIKLHHPVWLHWRGKIENEDGSQKPLELRVHGFGVQKEVYEKYIASAFFTKKKGDLHPRSFQQSYYPNGNGQNSLYKSKCIRKGSESSMAVQHKEKTFAFTEEDGYIPFLQKQGVVLSAEKLSRAVSSDYKSLFQKNSMRLQKQKQQICIKPEAYYVRTTAGRVLMNNLIS